MKLQYYKLKYLSCIKLPLDLAVTSLLLLRSEEHEAPAKKLLLLILKQMRNNPSSTLLLTNCLKLFFPQPRASSAETQPPCCELRVYEGGAQTFPTTECLEVSRERTWNCNEFCWCHQLRNANRWWYFTRACLDLIRTNSAGGKDCSLNSFRLWLCMHRICFWLS